MKKTIILAVAAGVIAAAVVIPGLASAGKPGAASISVPDGVFGGTTTATANPGGDTWVHVQCFTVEDGSMGMEAYSKVDANNQATFTLGPTPSWGSGAAACVAEEGTWGKRGFRAIATTTFVVNE